MSVIGRLIRDEESFLSRRRGLLGELWHIVERLLIQAYTGAGVEARAGPILFVQALGDLVTFNSLPSPSSRGA